jgi:hypothetical protein
VPASQLTLLLQPGPQAPQQRQQQQQQQAAAVLNSSYMSDGTGFVHMPNAEGAAAAVMAAHLAHASYAAAPAQVAGKF